MGRLLRWLLCRKAIVAGPARSRSMSSGRVVAFESRPSAPTPGLINAGVYMLRRDVLNMIEPDRKVSLEDEVFPALVNRRELFAWRVDARFIDIGTPESYDAAQTFF